MTAHHARPSRFTLLVHTPRRSTLCHWQPHEPSRPVEITPATGPDDAEVPDLMGGPLAA
ncbi:hypothetical protein [Streptomyces xinghaiensis]|uniref:hypothetical protein n=1 Tax=Streptomyces xinghaiensis TaxID=1038928 RepID=UPI002E0E8BD2|nr:hypothetical protein OG463_06630 [Streptomyces xinghaiensis]